jgi:uncharacterized membrane protein AbrB (regulator of aidB expression)
MKYTYSRLRDELYCEHNIGQLFFGRSENMNDEINNEDASIVIVVISVIVIGIVVSWILKNFGEGFKL